jgi:hypothetical protein
MPDFMGVDGASWIVSAVWLFVLGAIWYAPPVFGRAWSRAQGLPTEMTPEMRKRAVPGYIVAVVVAFVVSFTIGYLISNFGYLAYDGTGDSHMQFWNWKVPPGGLQAASYNDPNGFPGAVLSMVIAFGVWVVLAANSLVQVLFVGTSKRVWVINQAQNLVGFLGVGLIFNYIHT